MEHYDVIIIGSGIAGLNFALRAAEKHKRILIITKKEIAEAGTNFAQGGIAAVLSKLDNFEKHIKDTLIAGCFHNDKKAVSYMVKNGPAAIARLLKMGVPFTTDRGKILLTREGGHSERRIAFVSDYTGQAIEKVLVSKVRSHPHIKLFEHTVAVDLLVKNKICQGVQILRGKTFKNIFGDILVLATGGAGRLFANTTNPEISTGDGLAMAARAGCRFKDLEFVQFHPTALKIKNKPRFLISEAVRGEGAYLKNSHGERFMINIHPLAELAPRDIVARAIFEQEKMGPVYLDLRHEQTSFIKRRFQQIYKTLKTFGIDMAKKPIPVSPAAHYMCGGVKVNLHGETGIKNLYAFGEVACTGVHGANRLASNSLLEALVFSDRILKRIRIYKPVHENFKTPIFAPLNLKEKREILLLKTKLQRIMWECVGIERSRHSIENAVGEIQIIKNGLSKFSKQNRKTLELKNMAEAAILIAKAALARKESLGCHYRLDSRSKKSLGCHYRNGRTNLFA